MNEIQIGDEVHIVDIPQEKEDKEDKLGCLKWIIKRLYHRLFPTPVYTLQEGCKFWLVCTYKNGKIYSMMNKDTWRE